MLDCRVQEASIVWRETLTAVFVSMIGAAVFLAVLHDAGGDGGSYTAGILEGTIHHSLVRGR